MIAEDDEKIAQLESDYLESNGYETDLIADGNKVIPQLRRQEYDLVLLDIMLPGCSGYDIYRQIRDEIDVPILMVTPRTEAVDMIRGLGLGADDIHYLNIFFEKKVPIYINIDQKEFKRAIVKRIVNDHKGTIRAPNNNGLEIRITVFTGNSKIWIRQIF